MKHIKRKLYIFYFLMVAIFMFVFYFMLSYVVENRIEAKEQKRLNEDLISLTQYINEESTASDVVKTLDQVSPLINERINFSDTEGKLLYDSNPEKDRLEQSFSEAERQDILEGKMLSTTHLVDKNKSAAVYFVAQALIDSSDEIVGILKISSEIPDLADIIQLVFVLLTIGMLVLAFLLFLLLRKWMENITTPIDEMQAVLNRLSKKEYQTRYTNHSYEEIDSLGHSINHLAENLEQQQIDIQTSEERLYGLINHLVIGVLLLDENQCIRMSNPVMNNLLASNLDQKIGQKYTEDVKSSELITLIEKAYELNMALNDEISIYFPEEKILDVNIVPLPTQDRGAQDYIVLLYDITEIRRLESVRTEFTANVSHELKTPITALKGFSETLLDGAMHDEDVLVEFLEIMHKESTRLDAMVRDILQLSELEKKKISIFSEWVNVREVVDEVFQVLQQKIDQKNIVYHIEEKESVEIYANRDQLKQILMNLITNAVVYTPEKGVVTVKIDQNNHEAIFEITDNGFGIPLEDQERIFERFYRVDKARTRDSGGTGLGLSIVKWLIDNMNGKIELVSELNEGTTFKIVLPIEDNRL